MVIPNMEEVHPIVARDMEWVKKLWIKKAKMPEQLKENSLAVTPSTLFVDSLTSVKENRPN